MLFMSTYHQEELKIAYGLIQDKFDRARSGNYCEGLGSVALIRGVRHHIDGYSVILSPTPLLKQQIVEHDKASQRAQVELHDEAKPSM